MNKAILTGNVGKDPVIHHTQQGKAIASFSLATSDHWTDKDTNEKKQRTDWHQVVCFSEPLSKVIEKFVKTGSKVTVVGQIRYRKYTDKEGVERYATDIVLDNFKGEIELLGDKSTRPPPASSPDDYGESKTGERKPARDLDDEVPF
jgi:single-strand DNA-binding protein